MKGVTGQMTETLNVSIDINKIARYHQVQELLSLIDNNSSDITGVVRENYVELVEILGLEVAAIIHAHFKSILCVKYFYTEEFIVGLASKCTNKREKEKLALECGCSLQTIDKWLREARKHNIK